MEVLIVLIIGTIGPLMTFGHHIIVSQIIDFFGHTLILIGIMVIRVCTLTMLGVMDTHYMVGMLMIPIII